MAGNTVIGFVGDLTAVPEPFAFHRTELAAVPA